MRTWWCSRPFNVPTSTLDTDSDNTGTIERSALEEADEFLNPGNIIYRNIDDDNGNGVQDYLDPGPFKDANNNPVFDTELELIVLSIASPGALDLTGHTVTFTTSTNKLKLWASEDKQTLPSIVAIGGQIAVPTGIFVEGVDTCQQFIAIILKNPAGVVIDFDRVMITAVTLDAVAYRQQTVPFTPFPIPEALEAPGLGIRRNRDDDNDTGGSDHDDTVVWQENDLIRIDLNHAPAQAEGVGYKAARSDTKIQYWRDDYKSDWLLVEHGPMEASVTNDATIWAEWTSLDGGTSTFEYSVWDARHHRKVFVDNIVFKPFTSVVIVLGGNLQTPGDPNPSPGQQRIFDLAIDEYRVGGRDVYMHSYADVNGDGSGAIYDMIVSAINERGVTDVAIMGYSWGGGATYQLATRLDLNKWPGSGVTDITRPFTIPFTGYIDAMRHGTFAETRRPPTVFHCAQYQHTWTANPLEMAWGEPSGGNDDWDRTPLGVVHTTIDDHPTVLSFLHMRLHQKVAP